MCRESCAALHPALILVGRLALRTAGVFRGADGALHDGASVCDPVEVMVDKSDNRKQQPDNSNPKIMIVKK